MVLQVIRAMPDTAWHWYANLALYFLPISRGKKNSKQKLYMGTIDQYFIYLELPFKSKVGCVWLSGYNYVCLLSANLLSKLRLELDRFQGDLSPFHVGGERGEPNLHQTEGQTWTHIHRTWEIHKHKHTQKTMYILTTMMYSSRIASHQEQRCFVFA